MKSILGIIILLLAFNVNADNNHHKHHKQTNVTKQYTTKQYTTKKYITKKYITKKYTANNYNTNNYIVNSTTVIAAAMGQHNFDYGTYAFQKSIAAASINGYIAISAAMARRRCKDCGLFSASISSNFNSLGFGVGYTWGY